MGSPAPVAMVVLLALSRPASSLQQAPARGVALEIGKPLAAELREADPKDPKLGAGRFFEFTAKDAGDVTWSVDSFDFDANVAVCDSNGTPLSDAARDDDSGRGTNARVSVLVKAGSRYRVFAGSNDGTPGEFTITASGGSAPERTLLQTAVEAAEYFRDAAEHFRERGDLGRMLLALDVEGGWWKSAGREDTAVATWEEAVRRAAAAGAVDDQRSLLASLIELDQAKGDFASALKRAEILVALDATMPGPSPASWMFPLLLDRLGRKAEAEARFDACEKLRKSDPELVQPYVVVSLSRFLAWRGRHGEALALLRNAVAKLGAAKDDPNAPIFLIEIAGELAAASNDLGDVFGASDGYEQLAKAADAAGNPFAQANALIGRALVEARWRSFPEAFGHLAEARRILEATKRPDLIADLVDHEATIHIAAGEWDAAMTSLNDALARHQSLAADRRRALDLLNLGFVMQQKQLYEAAELNYEQARVLAAALHDEMILANALGNLGDLAGIRGDHPRVVQLCEEAALHLEKCGRFEYVASALLPVARSALVRNDLAACEKVLDRTNAMLDRSASEMLGGEVAARLRSALDEWGELEQDLVSRHVDAAAEAKARASVIERGWLAQDRWRGRMLLVGLQKRDDARGDKARPALSLETLRREILGQDALLVQFADAREELVAYVIDARTINRVVLGRRNEIAPLVGRFRALVGEGRGDDVLEVARRGGAIYDALLRKVLGSVPPSVRRLVIVPTNELALLPFDALVAAQRQDARRPMRWSDLDFVVDRFEVSVEPSAAVLLELGGRTTRRAGPALLIAAPLGSRPYPGLTVAAASEETSRSSDGAPGSDTELTGDLRPMREDVFPYAESLVQANAKSRLEEFRKFTKLASGSFVTPDFELHVGTDANLSVVRGDLRKFSLLHFACHGHAPEDPRATGLVLAPSADKSGLLNVFDVSQLALDADLTVLAACRTAVGAPLGGEGLQSLSRAFLQAGSRAVVASLWDVPTSPTAKLVRTFYAEFGRDRSLPIATALRNAKLAVKKGASSKSGDDVREDGVPPCYWAGFVHYGR